MTYKEWKKAFVDGDSKAKLTVSVDSGMLGTGWHQMKEWYQNNPNDSVWWLDVSSECVGEWVFSFDRKTKFNLFADYPQKLSPEQKVIFDNENPFWVNFFNE